MPKYSYDEVPYTSHPYRQSHPERMATVASLLGLDTAPIEQCRVLELGCAAGGNLLPQADRFPESEFVGIDLSTVQIDQGRKIVEELGVKNIELIHADMRQLPEGLGKFDYILAHGVFSWIPDEAQNALLDACRRLLTPHGVAYVSYNTYPGWRMRGMIRDMMSYRARNFKAPSDRIRQARALLHFLAESVPTTNNAYGILLNEELRMLQGKEDYYLFHEHLEDCNDPIYFHEFIERAEWHGLQYLAEADFSMTSVSNFPKHIESMLQSVASDVVEMEQYMDFVRNRMFRQTLLCHKDVEVDRSLKADRMLPLYVASSTKPETEIVDTSPGVQVTFRTSSSSTTTTDPIVKAALMHLGDVWPRYVPFTELVAVARSRISGGAALVDTQQATSDTANLAHPLLRCYATGHVELSMCPPRFSQTVSQTPMASRLARYQATQSDLVTNQKQESVRLDDIQRHVLSQLDGEQDHTKIAAHIISLIECRKLILHKAGNVVADRQSIEEIATESTSKALTQLADRALLVS